MNGMIDGLEELLRNLPVPGIDKKPPPVQMSEKDRVYIVEEKKRSNALLDPKRDTEKAVKYVLKSLCGMELKKDGDYNIRGGWTKKVSDYVGSVPGNEGINYHTYVEVKGISPGNTFYFGRLDKRNNEDEPSQFEKLTTALDDGNLVFLALGWWMAHSGVEYIVEERGKKKFARWYKDDLELQIALIPWDRWMQHCAGTKRRSLTHTILGNEFSDCMIYKTGNRWHLTPRHWWERRFEVFSSYCALARISEAKL